MTYKSVNVKNTAGFRKKNRLGLNDQKTETKHNIAWHRIVLYSLDSIEKPTQYSLLLLNEISKSFPFDLRSIHLIMNFIFDSVNVCLMNPKFGTHFPKRRWNPVIIIYSIIFLITAK